MSKLKLLVSASGWVGDEVGERLMERPGGTTGILYMEDNE